MADTMLQALARHWAGDSIAFLALVRAIDQSEGDILKAVQKGMPKVQTVAEAQDVLCRSACHALADYVAKTDPEGFVKFFGARWAPAGGVANDPTNLNANWVPNVSTIWRQQLAHGFDQL